MKDLLESEVVVTTHETFSAEGSFFKKRSVLWQLVVVDEGHRQLKNDKSQLSQKLKQVCLMSQTPEAITAYIRQCSKEEVMDRYCVFFYYFCVHVVSRRRGRNMHIVSGGGGERHTAMVSALLSSSYALSAEAPGRWALCKLSVSCGLRADGVLKMSATSSPVYG